MTPAEQWQQAIAQLAPMQRQEVLAGMLTVVGGREAMQHRGYVLDSGAAILATHWATGGTWTKKSHGKLVRARGLTKGQALTLAHVELDDVFHQDGTVLAIARPAGARGLVVGWTLARGDDLLLCHTLEGMRRCGVQRLLWAPLFPGGRPKRHVYEPRGTAEFLRRIGTEYAR